jgi:RNA polymerase sigma-70 factor (ECF subfamily)
MSRQLMTALQLAKIRLSPYTIHGKRIVVNDYSEIDRLFRPRITRYLARFTGRTEAEDLAQETMIKIERSLGGFSGGSTLATWIFRIATNTALDWQKSAYVRRNTSSTPIHDDRLPQRQSKDRKPEDSAIQEEMQACIRRLLDQMTEKNRAALLLSEFESLSAGEIANVLGISYENAKIRIFRSREALRKLLECSCHIYRDSDFNLACEPLGRM